MKKLRGKELDKALSEELKNMIELGHEVAPISRPIMQKRLNLTSRTTLGAEHRVMMIENARATQLKNAGLGINGKKKRNGLKEQNEILKSRIQELEKQRDELIEKMAMIINGAQAKGYNVEEIMMPIINLR